MCIDVYPMMFKKKKKLINHRTVKRDLNVSTCQNSSQLISSCVRNQHLTYRHCRRNETCQSHLREWRKTTMANLWHFRHIQRRRDVLGWLKRIVRLTLMTLSKQKWLTFGEDASRVVRVVSTLKFPVLKWSYFSYLQLVPHLLLKTCQNLFDANDRSIALLILLSS